MESCGQAIFSIAALAISLISIGFAVFSWRESHRPIVTARLQVRGDAGNAGAALELIVENTGNRPAVNVRLTADPEDLEKAFLAPRGDVLRKDIEYCLSGEPFIPCLEPGKTATNAFGAFQNKDLTGQDSTWIYKSSFDVEITYCGMKEKKCRPRTYANVIPIWLVDNTGFALGYWGKK